MVYKCACAICCTADDGQGQYGPSLDILLRQAGEEGASAPPASEGGALTGTLPRAAAQAGACKCRLDMGVHPEADELLYMCLSTPGDCDRKEEPPRRGLPPPIPPFVRSILALPPGAIVQESSKSGVTANTQMYMKYCICVVALHIILLDLSCTSVAKFQSWSLRLLSVC